MKDSLENQTDFVKPSDSQEIMELKNDLTKNTKNEQNKISMTNEDIVNIQNANNTNSSGFMKNKRSKTPDAKKKFNYLSMFSRSLKNFYHNNKQKDNDISNEEPLTLIQLKNKFHALLGKLNENSTKEIAFKQIKQLIEQNTTQESLRVYISALSSFDQNSSVSAKEIQALLYGFIAKTFQENLMDPLDKPPNIIKTINRLLTHIRNLYLKEQSYVVHKACALSITDIYNLSMPKDNMKSINILFIEPLISLIISGNGKNLQDGAAVCLSDFIYHLGKDDKSEISKKLLSTLDSKMVSLITKNTLDIPYLFEGFFNLLQFLPFETFANNMKEIYDRIITILSKNKANKYNYLTKVNCLNILSLIAQKCKSIADISIGYYQKDIIKVIEFNLKDKVLKVQQAAKEALDNWRELSALHKDLDNKKMMINNPGISLDKNNYILKNEPVGNFDKKMDKLTYFRNLAKMAKQENKKPDFDTELPANLREEVYQKGIGNILKLSNFLKYKNNNKNNQQINTQNYNMKSNGSLKRSSNENKLKMEIQDYLKYSDQVKKYNFNTNPNVLKAELNEVSEANEQNEISNSEIKQNPKKINKEIGKINFVEEEIGQGTQFANIENNTLKENESIKDDNIIQNQEPEFNLNTNTIGQRHNQLPKLDKQKRTKPLQMESISVKGDNNEINSLSHSPAIDLTQIKNSLSTLIQNNLLSTYNSFEKNISSRLIEMENRINDLYIKLTEYQSHPKYNKDNYNRQSNEEKDYYINNNKLKESPHIKNLENTQLDRNMIYKDVTNDVKNEITIMQKKDENGPDSQITKTWKDALRQIENNHHNEAYETILNSGDDIYLLRLVCLTGPIFNQLSPIIAKRILMRVNMISRSHQIQYLLISLIRQSIKYNIFSNLSNVEQNELLDSLFEFSGINCNLGSEAGELYAQITQ